MTKQMEPYTSKSRDKNHAPIYIMSITMEKRDTYAVSHFFEMGVSHFFEMGISSSIGVPGTGPVIASGSSVNFSNLEREKLINLKWALIRLVNIINLNLNITLQLRWAIGLAVEECYGSILPAI